VFVRAVDGRWLFAGHTSGGNNSWSCASSIIAHRDLLTAAEDYARSEDYFRRFGVPHSDEQAWKPDAALRFLNEIFESWSSPNPEALRRLETLYWGGAEYYKKGFTSREYITREKSAIFRRWPNRSYRIIHAKVTECFGNRSACYVSADVEWDLSNSDLHKRVTGKTKYIFLLTLWQGFWGFEAEERSIVAESSVTINKKEH
jgi:hypothetical protein